MAKYLYSKDASRRWKLKNNGMRISEQDEIFFISILECWKVLSLKNYDDGEEKSCLFSQMETSSFFLHPPISPSPP